MKYLKICCGLLIVVAAVLLIEPAIRFTVRIVHLMMIHPIESLCMAGLIGIAIIFYECLRPTDRS